MNDSVTQDAPEQPGDYRIFLAYRLADEDIAFALRKQLQRLSPGIKVWAEKGRAGVGDAYTERADRRMGKASIVLAIWTPGALQTGAFELEARRAVTLKKPFLNVLVGTSPLALKPPYKKYSTFEVPLLAPLADRSTGWLPAARPDRQSVDAQLKPLLAKIEQIGSPPKTDELPLSEAIIAATTQSAGAPHTAAFEAFVRSIAPGDPATAIEVLGINRYDEATMNALIAPQTVRIAPMGDGLEEPPYGSWYLDPPKRKIVAAHKDNGALYAIGGFLMAALAGATIWLLGSTLGEPGAGNAGTPASISANASGPAGLNTRAAGTDTGQDAAMATCTIGQDGAITGAPCRLDANIAPALPELTGTDMPAQPADAVPNLQTCFITRSGTIENTPCRLSAPYAPPEAFAGIDAPPACNIAEDGAISRVPCTLVESLAAPEPQIIEGEAPQLPACTVGDDGAITGAPCRMVASLPAPEPVVIEREGEVRTVVEALEACARPGPGGEVAPGCRLDRAVETAHATCNSDLTNLPCTLRDIPRRVTAALESDTSVGGPRTDVPPARPSGSAAIAPPVSLPPIEMPANLRPCEESLRAPCRFTVANAGLNTLTEIAETYYGNRNGWCRIYRANERTFGARNRPRRGADPNCIFMSDVLDLPAPTPDNSYVTRGCPAPQPQNRCGAPRE